jgi:NCS1 family nucleobase:cation symporter-1
MTTDGIGSADVSPIAPAGQTQSALDLFLIFVGANVVATTFQVGATLVPAFRLADALVLIVFGALVGAALVAALAPLGPRLRVPSVIVARAALGIRGAAIVALVLYGSNFAWIALNNVIASSACAMAFGGSSSSWARGAWAVALGLIATIVVARGPRAVARADRVAVPLLVAIAVALTVACVRARAPVGAAAGGIGWSRGLDIVVGYQVSWILMFADYSRYSSSRRGSAVAVFLGLALTSIWLMPLGALAANAAHSSDPGAMMFAVGLGRPGAVLLAVATLTTNFVNIYMSALALKSVVPQVRDRTAIWSIGLIGTGLGAIPGVWVEQYAGFMLVLAALLVPVGGVLLARFYLTRGGMAFDVDQLYDPHGPFGGWRAAGLVAWAVGGVAFLAAGAVGGTLPALAASTASYVAIERWGGRRRSVAAQPLKRIE